MAGPRAKAIGRGRLAALLLLLPLAALPAFRAEASRTGVWESNPPASVLARTQAASALDSLAPADHTDVVAAEPPRFDIGDVVLVESELEREERFDLGPLTLVDLNLLRGPPPSYPETRVGGFELLPPFRVGASPTLSLWPHRACGFPCLGLASDSRYDPWGLMEAPGSWSDADERLKRISQIRQEQSRAEEGRGFIGDFFGGMWDSITRPFQSGAGKVEQFNRGVQDAARDVWKRPEQRPRDPAIAEHGLNLYDALLERGYRDLGDISAVGAGVVLDLAEAELGGRLLSPAGGSAVATIKRTEKPGRAVFQGMEVRGVRSLAHVDEATLRAMSEYGFAAKDAQGRKLHLHHFGQNPKGPIVEVPGPFHKIANPVQHPRRNAAGAGLTSEERAAFDLWRQEYWRARAREELERRVAR